MSRAPSAALCRSGPPPLAGREASVPVGEGAAAPALLGKGARSLPGKAPGPFPGRAPGPFPGTGPSGKSSRKPVSETGSPSRKRDEPRGGETCSLPRGSSRGDGAERDGVRPGRRPGRP
ncbi:hypothetical protein CRV15_17445 [Streptomyces clavuligerus]|uniref:Uncharacterized protein n=1 Tax=Streptomyces clavuligerus TaxID=1901 RepID=B5GZP4_STRCL|nr:hypothetical protein D1794_18090 [Streptomyces clavuligerus]EDY51790.1 hypothetical protein SSCG_04861 [Streptomyces clavuligerus]EFG07281.1 Hypothetical protein SCLAV_2208 [Streptomyces clavuligerus]QCS07245.1 hypothetical protein CRV15_17445 [Streptomyces clavuligerus]QPJ93405.1 hypothetical protein GE265_10615 [Streptomyces clavuligerus]